MCDCIRVDKRWSDSWPRRRRARRQSWCLPWRCQYTRSVTNVHFQGRDHQRQSAAVINRGRYDDRSRCPTVVLASESSSFPSLCCTTATANLSFVFPSSCSPLNLVQHVEPTPFDIHETLEQRKGMRTSRFLQPWPRLACASVLRHVHVRVATFG